jgi:flagellar biosynthesis anti-sigma factor FlgM
MDIGSSLDSLRSLLGVSPAAPAPAQGKGSASTGAGGLGSDLATLSNAGSEVSQAAGGDGVRMDKVTAIQQALAAGTYFVPASAVAGKLVDSMMASGH